MINEMSKPGSEIEGIYDQCCCKDSGTCGPHRRYKLQTSHMVSCKYLNEDIQSYLVQLKVHQHFYIFIKP